MTNRLDKKKSTEIDVGGVLDPNIKVDLESTKVDTFAIEGLNKWMWRGAYFSPLTSYLLGGSFGNFNLIRELIALSVILCGGLIAIIMIFNGQVIFRDDPNDLAPSVKFFIRKIVLIQMFFFGNALAYILITCIRAVL